MKRFPAVLATVFALSACTSMPISSMIALSKIDVMTSDLSRLRIALSAPDALRPRPGGVYMEMTYSQGDSPPEKKRIRLDETTDAADLVGLPTADRGNQSIHAYRLSKQGILDLSEACVKVAVAKSQKKRGSLGVAIAAREFCLDGALPEGALLATTWMATSETQSYVVVARNYDLRGDKQVAAGLAKMPPCSGD